MTLPTQALNAEELDLIPAGIAGFIRHWRKDYCEKHHAERETVAVARAFDQLADYIETEKVLIHERKVVSLISKGLYERLHIPKALETK